MKMIQCANVVRLEKVIETSNNYYIVEEYCDGGELRGVLRRGRMEEREAVPLLCDLLRGYLPLFQAGIIHRDIKPENILLSAGVAKLADFGFAKRLYNFHRQMLKSYVGSPLYMAPQVLILLDKGEASKGGTLLDKTYTSKSDIWSMGLIFYEMLHGAHPFPSRSEKELLRNIRKGQP
jgi:serine/threonine protein kinase